MLQIIKKQIQFNISKRTEPIKYICLHYTGNYSKGANGLMHYKYFDGGNRNSSADFFVDDSNILQINDYNKNYTWAVGDGRGAYGITNANSISIEMCVNIDDNFNKTLFNTIELVRYLMKELNIDINHVVRHYDASKKSCPVMFVDNKLWDKFKIAVQGYEKILSTCTSSPDLWLDFINNNKNNILQYLPNLIKKVYVLGILEKECYDWKMILKTCNLSNIDDWLNEIPKHLYLNTLITKIYNY